jgi:hypothetical protein
MMVRETSILAYKRIKENGLLSKRRFEVYECLFQHGPMTQMEVCRKLNSEVAHDRSFTPRFSELKRLGVIREMGVTTCKIMNSTAILWEVTNKIPGKLKPKKKPREFWVWERGIESKTFKSKKEAHEHRVENGGKVTHVKQILKKLKL